MMQKFTSYLLVSQGRIFYRAFIETGVYSTNNKSSSVPIDEHREDVWKAKTFNDLIKHRRNARWITTKRTIGKTQDTSCLSDQKVYRKYYSEFEPIDR
jgi:hypothetical protein